MMRENAFVWGREAKGRTRFVAVPRVRNDGVE